MSSFKRDIYKSKFPPKPVKPIPQISWYRSEPYSKGATGVDFCKPITTPVYKNPNTIPIATTQTLYTDFQQTTPLQPVGGDSIYNILNQPLQNPQGQSNIAAVTVNSSGFILQIQYGDCNPQLNLVDIFITNIFRTSTEACSDLIQIHAKVDSDFIQGNVIQPGATLYTANSFNYNPQVFDVDSIGFSQAFFSRNVLGLSTLNSDLNNYSPYTMQINSNAVVDNLTYCIT